MLRKIDIEKFGSFKKYNWCNLLNNETNFFHKNNIIYGENYSGKTTLSRIIHSLETKKIHDDYMDNGKYTLFFGDGNEVNQNTLDNSTYKVATYNTDFISENLRWFMTDDGELKPFAIIGKDNVKIEREISDCNLRLEKENNSYPEVRARFVKYEDKYNSYKARKQGLLTDGAREIRESPHLYGKTSYNRPNLENDLDMLLTEEFIPLHKETVDKYKKIINDEIKEKVNLQKVRIPDLKYEISVKNINELLTKEISASNTVKKWVNDIQLSDWINEAYKIHKDKHSKCQFCGGKLDVKIFNKIEEHFSEQSKKLIEKLQNITSELEEISDNLEKYQLNTERFSASFERKLEMFQQNYSEFTREIDENINYIIKRLNSRIKNPFKVLEPINIKLNIKSRINALNLELGEIVKGNNSELDNLSEKQKEIKNELRLNKVYKKFKNFMGDNDGTLISYVEVLENEKELKRLKKWREVVFKNKKSRIDKIVKKKDNLKKQLKQEQATADQINNYMNYFFQNKEIELVFEENEGESFFKVYRDSSLAKNLSEGERRIISYCYFLTSIHDEIENEESRENLIIYIDDPISSLDINHIFTVFSTINTLIVRNGNYRQLFVSTHNLEFLKYLKKLDSNDIRYYQIIKRRREKDFDYKSYLTRMQRHLKDNATEFHYLFKEIKKMYDDLNEIPEQQITGKIQNSYTKFYNLPNIIRRFMEIYLFYKYPNTDGLYNKIITFLNAEIDGIFINRIINEYSHTRTFERANKPIELYELRKCIYLILNRIKELDPVQYEQLVESTK